MINSNEHNEISAFLNSVPLFEVLTPEQQEAMATSLTTHNFTNGHKIVNEGSSGDLFYVIWEGTVSCL
jgi:signal-transduction protein with cAMP-binding, CBS, and nucleotidyltransferase domain